VLLGISRSDDSGREAALKYFTLAAFASGFFLLGCSYLYGVAGSTSIDKIQQQIVLQRTPFCAVALALTLLGLSFRVTAVPFHFYAPDVFSGATLPMAATMSLVPKIAGFLGMVRILGGTQLITDIPPMVAILVVVIATLTMTIGNAGALVQTNLRRLMAYSSVAHSGYLMLGLAAIIYNGDSPVPIFNYLAAYSVMTIGLFAVVAAIRPAGEAAEDLSLFDGLFSRNMLAAVALMIALLSLTGIPLTAGFWAKLQIFLAAVKTENTLIRVVAIIMALNAAIGAVYYLGLLSRLFSSTTGAATGAASAQPTQPASSNLNWSTSAAALVCSVLTIVWFFAP
jgi:NADH-quinone oxidoreductase subunit N